MHKNWPVWKFFQSVSRQWRTDGFGTITGLDYAAVGVALSIEPKSRHKQLFRGVQMIEQGVLEWFSEKREKNK